MIDEADSEELSSAGDEVGAVSDVITELAVDAALPGIPVPFKRNFFKAFAHLCTALVEVPVTHLTGKADEIRAETSARIKLINMSANQIAGQMQTDPEYARVAVQKFGQRVLREQVNLDMISLKAANELQNDGDPTSGPAAEEAGDAISDDWLNAFETEARLKSTEEMQELFAKVLAGEIRKPGTFSTRAIRILGSLDQSVAKHFVRLCSLSVSSLPFDTRVPSLGRDAGQNALKEYGLDFKTLNLLNEHGLVISDYNSWRELKPCVALPGMPQLAACIPISHQGRHWILIPKTKGGIDKTLRISGVALTNCGSELLRVVKLEPVDNYTKAMDAWFEGQGFRMFEVEDGNPRVMPIDPVTGIPSE